MGAELSLKLSAQEDVSTAAKAAAGGVDTLKKSLGAAGGEAKQTEGKLISLRDVAHQYGRTMKSSAVLTNELGAAMSQSGSEAAKLGAGLVHAFGQGGLVPLAIAVTFTALQTLITKFEEARKKAEEARQAHVDEQIALAKGVTDQIEKADAEIASLKAKLGYGEDPSIIAARAAAADDERAKTEDVAKAEEKLAAARAASVAASKAGALGSLAAAEGALRIATDEAEAAHKSLETTQANNKALAERLELMESLRREEASMHGGAPSDRKKRGEGGDAKDPHAAEDAAAAREVENIIRRNRVANERIARDREKANDRMQRLADQAAEKGERSAEEAARRAREAAEKELKNQEVAAQAGTDFATSFAQAIKNGVESGDPLQFLKGAAMAVGKILSMLIPGVGGILGGGIFSLIGGILREGGPAQQVSIPKARRGMAFVDMDADGMLLEGHRGEVMMNAGAVARNGGIDRVSAQNNPLEPPMAGGGGGGGDVHVHLSTLTPKSSREAVITALEPVQSLRLRANQGKYTADLRRRLRRRSK